MSEDKVTQIILDDLKDIKAALADLQLQGCSKASEHIDMKSSIRDLYDKYNGLRSEFDQAKGKMAIIGLVAGGLATLLVQWIGSKL